MLFGAIVLILVAFLCLADLISILNVKIGGREVDGIITGTRQEEINQGRTGRSTVTIIDYQFEADGETLTGSRTNSSQPAIAGDKIVIIYNPRTKRSLVAADAEADLGNQAIKTLGLLIVGGAILIYRGKTRADDNDQDKEKRQKV
jgi:hypothetical protein